MPTEAETWQDRKRALALAKADVRIAIGGRTDVAVAVATDDVVLVKSNPADVPRAIQPAPRVQGKIKQSLLWAAICRRVYAKCGFA